jgi:hypothetical protein
MLTCSVSLWRMKLNCISGKRVFQTEAIAEDVLIELWSKNDYSENAAPIAIYKCEDCGYYHFTSRGPMNEKLSKYLSGNKARLDREANRWLNKFKHK